MTSEPTSASVGETKRTARPRLPLSALERAAELPAAWTWPWGAAAPGAGSGRAHTPRQAGRVRVPSDKAARAAGARGITRVPCCSGSRPRPLPRLRPSRSHARHSLGSVPFPCHLPLRLPSHDTRSRRGAKAAGFAFSSLPPGVAEDGRMPRRKRWGVGGARLLPQNEKLASDRSTHVKMRDAMEVRVC